MRHRKHKVVLDRTAAGRRRLLRNLATSIILYEKVTTTHGKAKAVVPLVERLIRVGQSPSLAHRRRLISELAVKSAAAKVVEVLGPRYQQRSGGCVRIVRLGTRSGDGAALARVELV